MDFSFQLLHPVYDILNDEVDVIVKIHSSQEEYHVTFMTYQRAQEIFKAQPFSIFSTTVFVQQLTEQEMENALQQVMNTQGASFIFYPLNEPSRIALFRKLERENSGHQ